MNYVPSQENMADVLTKPMTKGKSSTLLRVLLALKPLPLLSERNNTALVTAVISITANDSVTISF